MGSPDIDKTYACVVSGCGWTITMTFNAEAEVNQQTLASVFGLGVIESTARNAERQRVEDAIGRHLRSHDVLDFVKTIKALEAQVVQQMRTIIELTGQPTIPLPPAGVT